ncbi:MAG: ATP-dependent Clp protease ATP-binding subunit [Bacilli bacterium]|nr:ATP-dependent Clp protease ATP-binding subunit [Bacilli bacterium]
MFSKFDEDSQKVLLMARKEMLELKHPYVGSEHLLLSILHNDKEISSFLNKYGLNYDKYKKEIIRVIGVGNSKNNWFLYTPLLKRIIENAILDSKEEASEITVNKLFVSLLEEGDGVANRILMGMNIDIDALYDKFADKFLYKSRTHKKKLMIEKFSVNFNKKIESGEFDPVIGRDDLVNRMIEILLRRNKNNPLLIGDAGVGKTALVEELANRIVKGMVPTKLKNKKIFSLSMSSMVAGTKYRGEFEDRVNKIIDEVVESNDIILFIDEIHTIVGAGGAEGAIDASNILKPYLARGKIKLIGATTKQEYAKYLENDKALDRRFQKIYVEESSLEETNNILLKLKKIYENYHSIEIPNEIITNIVDLSDRYVSKGKQPDKAIDILDAACTKTLLKDSSFDKKIRSINSELSDISEKKNMAIIDHNFKLASDLKIKENFLESKLNKLILKNDKNKLKKKIDLNTIYEVIYNKTKIPIKDILNMNKRSIKKILKNIVIGQDNVINQVVDSFVYTKSSKRIKPYSFLFVGKSGVGKTFLVREYANMLYPKQAFIRLDMSEYKDSGSISKIVGSNPGYVGYDDKNTILEKVKNNPYSVILLDEIEKASPTVMKLFLQVLDEGYMNNSLGEKIDFTNCTIFMTSNLGSDKKSIGFIDNEYNIVVEKIKDFLGVELVNRIDKVILFNNLSSKTIDKIILNKLKEFCKNYNLSIDYNKYLDIIKNRFNYNDRGIRGIDTIIDEELRDVIK